MASNVGHTTVSLKEAHMLSVGLLTFLQASPRHIAVAALGLTLVRLIGPPEGLSDDKEIHAVGQLIQFGITVANSTQPTVLN